MLKIIMNEDNGEKEKKNTILLYLECMVKLLFEVL